MKPIFFPFTSLTPYDVKSILAFFKTFSYLSTESAEELELSGCEWFQPLLKESCSVEPVTLSPEELCPLLRSVKSWRSWADANYGKEIRSGHLKSIFRKRPYFAGDTDIFTIRSQIEQGSYSVKKDRAEDCKHEEGFLHKALNDCVAIDQPPLHDKYQETLNRALLFLRLAMITDYENEAIERKLSSIGQLEASLFSELKGELNNDLMPNRGSLVEDDRGALMTEERLRSWLTLFMAKQSHFKSSSSALFVTTSRAAIDFLISVCKKSKLMLDIDNFKVHKEKKSSCAGAWSETFQVQWNNDLRGEIENVLKRGNSLTPPELYMNIIDSELFQVAGQQGLTVMLVGVRE